MALTFREFLAELETPGTDVEDLSPDELNQRAMELRKQASLKSTSGGEEKARLRNIRLLQQKLRTATDGRQKADIQRRIRELMQQDKQPQM